MPNSGKVDPDLSEHLATLSFEDDTTRDARKGVASKSVKTNSKVHSKKQKPEIVESWEDDEYNDDDDDDNKAGKDSASVDDNDDGNTRHDDRESAESSTSSNTVSQQPGNSKTKSIARPPASSSSTSSSRSLMPSSSTRNNYNSFPSASLSYENSYDYNDSETNGKTNPPSVRPQKTTATASRLIAGALGLKAPKRTEEQRAYDRAAREQETKRRADEQKTLALKKESEKRAKEEMWEG